MNRKERSEERYLYPHLLFELVKYFPGKLVFLGASVVPMILVFFLYTVPWLDRNPERDIRRRRGPALVALSLFLIMLTLLYRGWR